jgi:hypothetical protein
MSTLAASPQLVVLQGFGAKRHLKISDSELFNF